MFVSSFALNDLITHVMVSCSKYYNIMLLFCVKCMFMCMCGICVRVAVVTLLKIYLASSETMR